MAKRGSNEYDDNRFHIDQSFVVNPPAISTLHGVEIPPYGGDTIFTDLVAAYEELSEPVQTLIDGLRAVHANVSHVDPEARRARIRGFSNGSSTRPSTPWCGSIRSPARKASSSNRG